MENIFQKISEKKFDEEIHREFLKYSKGIFEKKYLLDAEAKKDSWSIKTGPEFANFLVKACAEKAESKIKVKGVIITTLDIKKDLPFENADVSQFMGIKKISVSGEIEKEKLVELMNKHPKAFYALSFSWKFGELKIKPKAPKSPKPSATGEKEAKADFCSLKTSEGEIVKSLLFDVPEGKEINLSHDIIIKEIEIPKNEKDPALMREKSIRKGIVKRNIKVDGKEIVKEYEFVA